MCDSCLILITPLPVTCPSRRFRSLGGCRPHAWMVWSMFMQPEDRGVAGHLVGRQHRGAEDGGALPGRAGLRWGGKGQAGAGLGDGLASPAVLWVCRSSACMQCPSAGRVTMTVAVLGRKSSGHEQPLCPQQPSRLEPARPFTSLLFVPSSSPPRPCLVPASSPLSGHQPPSPTHGYLWPELWGETAVY